MIKNTQFDPVRIEALKNILLKLHDGASPESVQEDFDKHFKNVSAIEISLMEHELMSGDHGISFEDVMQLCNVHANLLGGAVDDDIDAPETTHPGHPVQVFKNENMAFQAALIRIDRIIKTAEENSELLKEAGMLAGFKNQLNLLGQFFTHYDRKEKLFFPIMERNGHNAPPKVMWGVDDEIRELFKVTMRKVDQLPEVDFSKVVEAYREFEHEFKEMIFKEESILLPMVLSFFTEDDWLSIARDSDKIGYAIIEPEEEWVPERKDFSKAEDDENTESLVISEDKAEISLEQLAAKVELLEKQVADLTSKVDNGSGAAEPVSNKTDLQFGGGYLTINEANLILNNLPVEITFVDKNDVFKYFNSHPEGYEMMFPRTEGMVGRKVENCHPPKSLDMVLQLMEDLKSKERTEENMWIKSRGKYIYVTYKGVYDEQGEYVGILELVQDIQPFFELPVEIKRDLSPLEED